MLIYCSSELIQGIHELMVNGKMKKTWKAALLNARSSSCVMTFTDIKTTSKGHRMAFTAMFFKAGIFACT